MPYSVIYKEPKGDEISLDQLLFQEVDTEQKHKKRYYPGTVTRYYDSLPDSFYTAEDIQNIIQGLNNLHLFDFLSTNNNILEKHYKTFYIPKKTGGQREICAPDNTLSNYQIELRDYFFDHMNALYHTSAFAYSKGRNTLKCMRRHQANESRWFLKLDFKDFFGSTNKEFVIRQLEMISPFSEVLKDIKGREVLSKALDICFLKNKLPQGTPISPMLTNLIMIPVDFTINKKMREAGLVYTRYADDMQISSKFNFNKDAAIQIVKDAMNEFHAPYILNEKKTRYGSSSGRNWNLGLMLNKDNKITIGHKNHKLLKAKINNLILKYKNNEVLGSEEIYKILGEISYFKSIEPEYAYHLISHLENKYHVSIKNICKNCIVTQRILIWKNEVRYHENDDLNEDAFHRDYDEIPF